MGTLRAVYYRTSDGTEPVDAFIEALDVKRQVSLDNQIGRLNTLTPEDPHLPFPHSSQLRGDLRELPCHYGRELYRILYVRSRSLLILLHAFRKNTGSVPQREILIAQGRWDDFVRRMDADPRVPPRAAGRDAP
ncbi:MAG: type II toxin-antitoxin system RelE/ParE family toxin [Actinomycetota bacterium]